MEYVADRLVLIARAEAPPRGRSSLIPQNSSRAIQTAGPPCLYSDAVSSPT